VTQAGKPVRQSVDPSLRDPIMGRRRRGAIAIRVFDAATLLRQDRVTLGALVDRLGPEGLGLALLLLALPSLIPVPGPIGLTFGGLIAVVALQVMSGARALWLPSVLRRRTLPSAMLRNVLARAWPGLSRAERMLQEGRLVGLTGRRARMVLALPLLLLAVTIMLPIPLGNIAPALALIVFSLGFMARDGAAILVALVLSLMALIWTGFLFVAGAAVLEWASGLMGW
jgi:hypothetical protein